MKIIIFTENNRGGGMDTFIASLVNNWPKKEDTFTVVCNQNHPGLEYLANLLPNNTKLVKHAIPLNWSLAANLLAILPSFIQRVLRQLFRVLLAPIQYILIKKLLIQENGDHLFSVNGGYPGGETCRLVNIAWKKLNKTQSVHNIHNFAIEYRKVFSLYETFMDKQLEASCSHIVAVSKACADSLSVRPIFSKSKKITFIYNGLNDKSKLSLTKGMKDILDIRNEDKLLVVIGTFEERKGHEFLLKAMSYVYQKHPNVHLAIVGDGSKSEILRVKGHIEKYAPNKNIYLPGFMNNIQQVLNGTDILLVPSQDFESFGLTALEAMMNAIPVVSTDTGGLPETIGENLVTGFYSAKDNHVLYSKNICYLLDNNHIRKKIGLNGNRRAERLFSSSKMSKNYHGLL